jgi:hypothetical protein
MRTATPSRSGPQHARRHAQGIVQTLGREPDVLAESVATDRDEIHVITLLHYLYEPEPRWHHIVASDPAAPLGSRLDSYDVPERPVVVRVYRSDGLRPVAQAEKLMRALLRSPESSSAGEGWCRTSADTLDGIADALGLTRVTG